MNSPGAASNRSSLSGLQDLYDGNGLMRRERNFSGQSLTIPPFPAIFTQEELATYFQYFGAHKIRYITTVTKTVMVISERTCFGPPPPDIPSLILYHAY